MLLSNSYYYKAIVGDLYSLPDSFHPVLPGMFNVVLLLLFIKLKVTFVFLLICIIININTKHF